ncbi:replicative DNA helicase [Clostridium thermobutyricum]|uniref:replicative DNA helicase n=1 Tax=Clostridium thermobutyricum TaxID=29372 RepID=UPI001FAD5D66|nr:replicative DNA helicase [Clostridium thermobutyricum]
MNNIEAEIEVLGAILNDDKNLPNCLDKINEEDFYLERHKILFRKMKELYAIGKRVNLINIVNYIGKEKIIEFGGVSYISSLIEGGRNLDINSYLEIIKECSLKRKLKVSLEKSLEALIKGEEELSAIKTRIYKGLETGDEIKRNILEDKDLMFKTLEEIENRFNKGGEVLGMETGYKSLDRLLNGLKKGELVILAGRPAMGKTVTALNIMDGLADRGYKVLLNELEMTEEAIGMRRLAYRTNTKSIAIQNGRLTEEEFIKITNEYSLLSKRGNVYTDCSYNQTLMSIMSRAKVLKETKGLDVLIIDYLGLMEMKIKDTRANAVGEITRGLKILAKKLDINIILLCQLSRNVEGRMDKRPMLSDLRDSGSIEQDADVVIFTYRDSYYNKEVTEEEIELIVAKNRNGKDGIVKFKFYGEYQKIA